MKITAFALCLTASTAFADGCPVAPDHTPALDKLFAELQVASGDMEARVISNQLWELWLEAPDEPSQTMLDQGMRHRSSFDYIAAKERFDALVGYCPFYAEGYNQRAFVSFLREEFEQALPDLDRALELNPRHVGALSGKALTLFQMGRDLDGQIVLRQALELNPWLGERFLLKPLPGEEL
ncbi:tetratricopeptide repeat protein [Thalassococcus lentus]|uniref:Tetratricopeptide repeat protein n=1 Tax=Thalassococcus lentus TaxID=1210524 RepID=A0ABT4XWL6_9RHOB|nr:tetratricopeptide repeat protein [Thalassococcus lentus]MDA7426364.1 hypothetical protein [Thalassococcus lentus]